MVLHLALLWSLLHLSHASIREILQARLSENDFNSATVIQGRVSPRKRRGSSTLQINGTSLQQQAALTATLHELIIKLKPDASTSAVTVVQRSEEEEGQLLRMIPRDDHLVVPLNSDQIRSLQLQFRVHRPAHEIEEAHLVSFTRSEAELSEEEELMLPRQRNRRDAEDNLTDTHGDNRPCRRENLFLRFPEGVFPNERNIYRCTGTCAQAPSRLLSAHARLAKLKLGNDFVPCCAPTSFIGLNFLFDYGNGTVRSDFKKDAIVTECGCR